MLLLTKQVRNGKYARIIQIIFNQTANSVLVGIVLHPGLYNIIKYRTLARGFCTFNSGFWLPSYHFLCLLQLYNAQFIREKKVHPFFDINSGITDRDYTNKNNN